MTRVEREKQERTQVKYATDRGGGGFRYRESRQNLKADERG